MPGDFKPQQQRPQKPQVGKAPAPQPAQQLFPIALANNRNTFLARPNTVYDAICNATLVLGLLATNVR